MIRYTERLDKFADRGHVGSEEQRSKDRALSHARALWHARVARRDAEECWPSLTNCWRLDRYEWSQATDRQTNRQTDERTDKQKDSAIAQSRIPSGGGLKTLTIYCTTFMFINISIQLNRV